MNEPLLQLSRVQTGDVPSQPPGRLLGFLPVLRSRPPLQKVQRGRACDSHGRSYLGIMLSRYAPGVNITAVPLLPISARGFGPSP